MDLALSLGKPFAVVPCCVHAKQFPARRLRSGVRVTTYGQLVQYLLERGSSRGGSSTRNNVGSETRPSAAETAASSLAACGAEGAAVSGSGAECVVGVSEADTCASRGGGEQDLIDEQRQAVPAAGDIDADAGKLMHGCKRPAIMVVRAAQLPFEGKNWVVYGMLVQP